MLTTNGFNSEKFLDKVDSVRDLISGFSDEHVWAIARLYINHRIVPNLAQLVAIEEMQIRSMRYTDGFPQA